MPLNPLFWSVVVVAVLAFAVTWWRRRSAVSQTGTRTRQGPIPGYSFTPGREFAVDQEALPVKPDQWRAQSVETFHTAERTRVIIQLKIEQTTPERTIELIEHLARDIYRRSEAHVVLLEALTGKGSPPYLYLFAPDGRGWWGKEHVTTALQGPDMTTRCR